jgi:hypothetical protein
MDSRECAGRLEWHHAVKQQRLRREFPVGAWRLTHGDVTWKRIEPRWPVPPIVPNEVVSLDDILGDPRNRVWLCSHHHELVTNGRLDVALPRSVWEFAREFGLDAQLENDLARRSAA